MGSARRMLAMAAHKAQNKTHHEHHSVQTICSGQRRQRAAVGNDRPGDHEGQHGADGAAGQNKVNQFW